MHIYYIFIYIKFSAEPVHFHMYKLTHISKLPKSGSLLAGYTSHRDEQYHGGGSYYIDEVCYTG